MEDDFETRTDAKKRQRLVNRLDLLVESGYLTAQEAGGVRAASERSEFDDVVRDIRVKHAALSLHAAVEDGRLTQLEADGFLERLRNGEHPRSLRARLRGLHTGGGFGSRVPAWLGPEDDAPQDPST